jgi:hypothetical protein
MATVTIKQEVEATPEVIADELAKYVDTLPPGPFPYKEGDLIQLDDSLLKAIGAVLGMPVRVLAASQQSGTAFVAFFNQTSHQVTWALIHTTQVKKPGV